MTVCLRCCLTEASNPNRLIYPSDGRENICSTSTCPADTCASEQRPFVPDSVPPDRDGIRAHSGHHCKFHRSFKQLEDLHRDLPTVRGASGLNSLPLEQTNCRRPQGIQFVFPLEAQDKLPPGTEELVYPTPIVFLLSFSEPLSHPKSNHPNGGLNQST